MKPIGLMAVAAVAVLAVWNSAQGSSDPLAAESSHAAQRADSAGQTPPVLPPGRRALPEIPKTGRVTVVKIDKVIDLGLAPFIDRIAAAGEPGDLLVFDINTLGGRV